MILPIFNHLHYLTTKGQKQINEHQSRPDTKLIYMDCGCVVLAEYSKDFNLYRHFTVPCDKHKELREHRFSFQKAWELRQQLAGQLIVNDESPCSMEEFLEVNYFQLNPENKDVTPITSADVQIILNLPIGDKYHTGHSTVTRTF